jgi:ABC-type branched-subunit amino acid transport system ATPase component
MQLRKVRDSGVAILIVDHDMKLVLSLCDEVAVLDFGNLIARGTAEDIRKDRNVAVAYLGTELGELGT